MKPSILKIKGLNSFLQSETIDFEKLTSRGLFGIFGPTGSGKSTILDAITLAIYGEVARKTKSYINSDVDKAYIYFEFISGHGTSKKKYIIERTIKRTKTGTQTAKVKLEVYDCNDNLENVIENRTPVEKELSENIIKLNFEDFIRTVVLPQGKFSEFLTLTGAERNNMLERILGLEEYGKSLTTKINNKKDITNNRLNYLEGELKGYSDLSRVNIEDLKIKEKEVLESEQNLKTQLLELDKDYNKYKQIYSLQEELDSYLEKYKEISKTSEEISKSKHRLIKAKDALHISPYIETLDNNIKEQDENNKAIETLDTQLEKLCCEIDSIEPKYDKSYQLKEKEYPKLLEQKSNISRAIELEKEKINMKELLKKEEKEYETLKLKKDDLKERIKYINDEKQDQDHRIEQIEVAIKEKTISSSYRNKLIEGVDIEKRYNDINRDLKSKQQEYLDINEKKKDIKKEVDKSDESLKKLEIRLEEDKLDYIALKQLLALKEKQLSEKKEDRDKLKEKSLASILAKKLEPNMQCPVCGSVEHPGAFKNKDVEDDELISIEEYIEALDHDIKTLDSQLKFIDSMFFSQKIEFKNYDSSNNAEKLEAISLWEENIEELKKSLEDIKNDKQEIENTRLRDITRLESIEENLKTLLVSEENLEKEKEKIENEYKHVKETLKVDSIMAKYKQVQAIEEEIEKLNDKLNIDRNKLKKIVLLITDLDSNLNSCNIKREGLNISIKNKREVIDKNNNEILKITDNESPLKLKKAIEEKIDDIIKNEKNLKIKLEELKNENNKLKNQYVTVIDYREKLGITLKTTKEKIDSLIDQYGFESVEQVRQSSMNKEDIDILEKGIKKHKKEEENISSNITRIEKLLGEESITKEALNELKDEMEAAQSKKSEILEEKGKIQEQLNEMNKNIEAVKKIKKDIKQLELRKDSLDEIFKITKGKRFVEFVSRSHLDYIARVATEKLKSITRGRYGLTLNSDNAFEVIDNHNGGVSRDCSSLSGGETFLTSLALALALSTKIQLKGDTSMEFFFLDEGFGTLDIETLDTAMTALENLYTENLSVGIISHVEEIKNRVPIKLMVSSPIPGAHGSQVRIVKT